MSPMSPALQEPTKMTEIHKTDNWLIYLLHVQIKKKKSEKTQNAQECDQREKEIEMAQTYKKKNHDLCVNTEKKVNENFNEI